MIIYIAGPITGHINYRAKFNEARYMLEDMGHIVINPAILPSGLDDYMGICIEMLKQADTIYMLEGWQNSKGARIEHEKAKELGKKIIRQNEEVVDYYYFEDILPERGEEIEVYILGDWSEAKLYYEEENGRYRLVDEYDREFESVAEIWKYKSVAVQ